MHRGWCSPIYAITARCLEPENLTNFTENGGTVALLNWGNGFNHAMNVGPKPDALLEFYDHVVESPPACVFLADDSSASIP